MIQRKRKQLVYSTEGDNYIRPDFNIKSIFIPGSQDQRTKASAPIEPIQPFEPAAPIKPPSTIQRTSESLSKDREIKGTNQRPGGIDPFYRSRDTTKIKKQYQLYKEQVKQIKDPVV